MHCVASKQYWCFSIFFKGFARNNEDFLIFFFTSVGGDASDCLHKTWHVVTSCSGAGGGHRQLCEKAVQ